jgi:hypothetical protein
MEMLFTIHPYQTNSCGSLIFMGFKILDQSNHFFTDFRLQFAVILVNELVFATKFCSVL